ncbi:hypothetical protein AYO20_05895 [Fonsecaea nubica]|uniref:Uncharacterized protein n=1 Tax=Fonsecaea nubica TaxID=856822 RepID=A0A178D0J0_9EURO|nr:hypothetical protein AYO20_05895 [Fonsecaea nubica]OAL34934.1 hypothetical protein AYO20_05895 [Fonsecaea nubica]
MPTSVYQVSQRQAFNIRKLAFGVSLLDELCSMLVRHEVFMRKLASHDFVDHASKFENVGIRFSTTDAATFKVNYLEPIMYQDGILRPDIAVYYPPFVYVL